MVSSKWANAEQDAADELRRKREKQEKRRVKAERQRLTEGSHLQSVQEDAVADAADRPAKRRRVSADETNTGPTPLLRFHAPVYPPAREVSEFEILNPIEEGSYGFVSRARERASGTIVALKRVKPDPGMARNGIPVTTLREIQALQRCRGNRNIVNLREVVTDSSNAAGLAYPDTYLVMDFAEHDLKSLLEDMPSPFQPSEVKTLMLQLTSALSHIHSHWILHRDLKTSNILLTASGTLKLADFGMARSTSAPPPANLTTLVVTLWYRAPEILLGAREYDFAVDMWSLGCIFAELLSREPLLQGRNEVDQLAKTFAVVGRPTKTSWPGYQRLPHAKTLPSPSAAHAKGDTHTLPTMFTKQLTPAGRELLRDLLSLAPAARPSAEESLRHEYFAEAPRAKPEELFPTFPSKAGLEKRRRRQTPHAPAREDVNVGKAVDYGTVFSGLA